MRLTQKAQMSLIMMLVIAIALMFYAVSVNWTKIAAKKTQVTIAANLGAANVATQVASYGEYLLQSQMDNATKQVDKTSAWWKWMLSGLLYLAAAVLIIIPTGFTQALGVMLILSGVGMTVDAAQDSWGTQARASKEWAKAIANITTTEGRFAEQGVQAMLPGVVNDDVQVDDRLDMDMDGRWFLPDPAPGSGDKGAPKISRFMYYNTQRLLYLPSPVPFYVLQDVLKDMQGKLGLPPAVQNAHACDRDPQTKKLLPLQTFAQCDPCCVAPSARPPGCDTTTAFLPQCANANNPGCTLSSLNACFIYDPMYEVRGATDPNLFMGTLGEDDTDPHTKVVGGKLQPESSPFLPIAIAGSLPYSGDVQETNDGGVFRGADATGKFFPMLWDFADTNTYVKDLWADGVSIGTASPACPWRAKDGTGVPACEVDIAAVAPLTIGQAYYRPTVTGGVYDQLNLAATCSYGDCYVNMFKNTLDPSADLSSPSSNYDPRRIDGVRGLKVFMPPIADDQCPVDSTGQYWKKGSDRLGQTFLEEWAFTPEADPTDPQWIPVQETHSTVYPIKIMSGNNMTPASGCTDAAEEADENSCKCGVTDLVNERWRDDALDTSVKSLYDFASMALQLVTVPQADFRTMLNTTPTWGDPLVDATLYLDAMTSRLDVAVQDMNKWLAGNTGVPGNNLDYEYRGADLWCLPPDNDPSLKQVEIDSILYGTDPSTGQPVAWGSLTSVIQCLNYNAGNFGKFDNCYNNSYIPATSTVPASCDPKPCMDTAHPLPRSLLPGFDPDPSHMADGGSFTETQRGACTWDPSCLTYAGLTSCETTPIADLTTFRNNMLIDTTLYGKLDVGPYYANLPTVDAAIYNRIMTEDPTVTADETTALNTTLVDLICPLPTEQEIGHLWCEKATPPLNQDSPYMITVRQSRDLAANQGAKFAKRAAYLSDLMTRVEDVRDVFSTAYQYLKANMNVPTAKALLGTSEPPTTTIRDIVQWFKDHMGEKADGLGNDVIYGWFSKPPKGFQRDYGPSDLGPLHLVRVQSSSPGYRKDLKDTFSVIKKDLADKGGKERLPTIDTKTNWNGMKRTYTLNDRKGYVGVRVIRYDEDQGGVVRFLSGLPIWQLLFRNPHQAASDPAAAIKEVYANCTKHHYLRVFRNGATDYDEDPVSNKGDLANGFIFDLPMGSIANAPALAACVSNVFSLLQRGVASETCAQYSTYCLQTPDNVHPEGRDCHYDIKFSSCK